MEECFRNKRLPFATKKCVATILKRRQDHDLTLDSVTWKNFDDPIANTDAMLVPLEHISAKVPKGRHAILILDQAAWHTTKQLQKFRNLTLLSLAPASPELNPTEQVWQTLRDMYLANRCYKNYEDILQVCCDAWNRWVDIPGNMKNLCTRSWANL